MIYLITKNFTTFPSLSEAFSKVFWFLISYIFFSDRKKYFIIIDIIYEIINEYEINGTKYIKL